MDIRNKINEFMDKALFNYDLPGLAVGISIGNKSININAGLKYANAVGYEDFSNKKILTKDSIFHMASVTKLFVGTSIMQLWEKGLINLDEKVVYYLPWFKMADTRYKSITIRQLLSHTSGMPDVKDYCWDKPQLDEGALERYVRSKEVSEAYLLWNPEERKFAYSNIGYEILGAIIAKVSGISFEEYVEENIFEPLSMANSKLLTFERCKNIKNAEESLDIEKLNNCSVCVPHKKNKDNHIIRENYFPYNRAHGPSSTLTSNISDLEKWAKAHLNKEILNEKTYDIVWKEEALVPNNKEHICLSWFKREQNNYTLYGHEGSDDGFRSSFWICPMVDLHIMVASNLSNAPVKKISKQIFDMLTN
ncbi:serine hydrolase domain-containing protein [Anaerovorax odorimutans]|uniref:serine hydrolase domain-containing protein n=1 Tax=Anaerovorax odorimutans TaxID=109327 RepID=UPI0003FC12AA|nr:serine hydrolase domain-containing protein [Anaerovorax odorimutans]